ncbi:MAG: hypothetical protein ABIO02_00490 [Patescibacteria group bacterium]
MKVNFLSKQKDLKKEKEDFKKFWKEQFAELNRKQISLPIKLYQL